MRNRWKKFRHGVEFQGVRLALGVIIRAPRSALFLSRCAASAAFYLCPGRRRIACANILRSGLARETVAVRRLALRSYHHMAAVVVESVMAGRRINSSNWREHVQLEIDPETYDILRDDSRGLILATGHLGNWETAGHILSHITRLSAVARLLHNPKVQGLLDEYGARSRIRIIPKHGARPAQLVRCLRDEGRALALLIDQFSYHVHAPRPLFFGHPASTHPSAAILSRLACVPIAFSYAVRIGFLRYRLVVEPPWLPEKTRNRREDEARIMQRLTMRLEDAVRRYPEQYLWAHRRWREEELG